MIQNQHIITQLSSRISGLSIQSSLIYFGFYRPLIIAMALRQLAAAAPGMPIVSLYTYSNSSRSADTSGECRIIFAIPFAAWSFCISTKLSACCPWAIVCMLPLGSTPTLMSLATSCLKMISKCARTPNIAVSLGLTHVRRHHQTSAIVPFHICIVFNLNWPFCIFRWTIFRCYNTKWSYFWGLFR